MDIGDSINPAIDIGQIEGAFAQALKSATLLTNTQKIQGYGLFTMEEIKVRPNGVRLSRGKDS